MRALPRTDHLDPRYPIDAYEDDLVALIASEVKKARIDELNVYQNEVNDLMSEGTPGVDDLVERGYLENYHEQRLATLTQEKNK